MSEQEIRQSAMQYAVATASSGEPHDVVLERAKAYAEFLRGEE